MTGRRVETWKKFNFATPPGWAYALLILICLGGLGFIAFAIVLAVVSQRASGYLPLTSSSSRTATLALWIPVGLLLAGPVAFAIALIVALASNDATAATITAVFLSLGILAFGVGLLGALVFTRLFRQRDTSMETASAH